MLTAKNFATAFATFILSLGLLSISPAVRATSTADTIDVGDSTTAAGINWTYDYDSVTGFGEFTITGDVTITGSTTTNQILVAPGTVANITLSNASVDLQNTPVVGLSGLSAFYIDSYGGGAVVNLTIDGANKLTSSAYSGIQVLEGSALTINGTDADVLTVIGGSAGIGGSGSMGDVTINGGTISATGGAYGAGIGGGCFSAWGGAGPLVPFYATIAITGGHVTATGGQEGAGIGGKDCVVKISGGAVDAYGGQYGAGIGGDGRAGDLTAAGLGSAGGTIIITGGTVNATGGKYGAGIGGGGGGGTMGSSGNGGIGGAGGDISISGNAQVTATAGESAAGIGGGAGTGASANLVSSRGGVGGAGGNIIISDSAVVSASGNGLGAGIGGGGGTPGNTPFSIGATGGAAGNILIYGESTQVTAKKGSSTLAKDIGAGAGNSAMGSTGNVFVALTAANLTLSLPPATMANSVLFTADPASVAGIVKATLPAPFNAAPFGAGTIDLLTGLDTTGKPMSVITTFTTQATSFSLAGFSNSPITKTGTALMQSGASVNFLAGADIVIDLAEITLAAPALGAAPDTLAAAIGDFTVSIVTWTPADPAFRFGTYTASVTLTPNSGHTFAGGLTIANINGKSATVTDNGNGTVTLSYQFVLKQTNTTIPALNPAMLALLALALMMAAGAMTRMRWRV
ncbi:MAG: hypothetical protein LBB65_00550 [Burkholderiales bacterium]|jgi:hypothetical protein|nr:hypothetical protein [Burkholderiales bacterium]